jgi:hypothetical protein
VHAHQGALDRLDRAEVIAAERSGQEAAVTLEIAVDADGVTAAGMQIGAIDVGLSDLDEGVADRLAGLAEQPAGQVRDLADRGAAPKVMPRSHCRRSDRIR